MTVLDWLVVTAYMVGMLAVGVYYARRTTSTEDYLLGGRSMNAISVGVSLFAALSSTVSCLATPGEMIKHGPMYLSYVLTYPIVFVIAGFLLIPAIMKTQVESAYEILESRLGLGIRLLGSSLFLIMRLLWMSMILYVTTAEIVMPLMRLPPWSTPYVAATIGLVTVIYTSMGGLRAVVVTDVIQTMILLCATIMTLVVVSFALGGVGEWWPTHWATHWDTFRIGIQSGSRMTMMAAALAGLTWWICVAGSDQIAIQRYLATRDTRAARTSLAVSLLASTISALLFGLVGLALLAYFQNRPDLLPAGASVTGNADKLFPQFIVIGFPTGMTGLVIAGLLSAAMDSLSSGINSSCSVITVDFMDRLGRSSSSEAVHMRRTKAISWILGILTIVASMAIGHIEGNLIEISVKVVNLLVAPLFVLFFLALFVPWATWLGAIAAEVASIAVAVGVAYFGWFDLGFMWNTPASLLAGVIAGPLFSLIPVTRPTRRIETRSVESEALPQLD